MATEERGGESTVDGRALLADLFETHHDRVHRFVLARSGSVAMAEDVTGDTFADAARLCAAGRGTEVTEAWLITVARRRLADRWRSRFRQRRREHRLAALPRRDEPEPATADDDVLEALASLGDRQRAALTLRHLDDRSVAEVADELDLTYQATESLLARARRSFRVAYDARREDV